MAKRDDIHITKQESTRLKIELAGAALRREGVKPSFIGVSTRRHVTQSNKYLCGKLSVLCGTMRENEIAYPWH